MSGNGRLCIADRDLLSCVPVPTYRDISRMGLSDNRADFSCSKKFLLGCFRYAAYNSINHVNRAFGELQSCSYSFDVGRISGAVFSEYSSSSGDIDVCASSCTLIPA